MFVFLNLVFVIPCLKALTANGALRDPEKYLCQFVECDCAGSFCRFQEEFLTFTLGIIYCNN